MIVDTRSASRSAMVYGMLMLATMAAGLLSRSSLVSLPEFVASYAGDALWALMVFWMFGLLFRDKNTWNIALYAFLFAYAIELSQLYHAPWIDAVRHFKLGGLILGYGFKLTDLICYATGILTGAVVEVLILKPGSSEGY